MEFFTRLRQVREERQITLTEMADDLQYAYTLLSNYEKGRINPPVKELIRMSEYLNVSLDYLLGVVSIEAPFPKESKTEVEQEAMA